MTTVYIEPAVLWERVTSRIIVTAQGCWEWRGARTSQGYGCIGAGRKGKSVTTHRLAVLVRDGQLDDDMTVDHTCHNADKACLGGPTCRHRRCVNPAHLEVVTAAVNTARRFRDRCPNGHDYTPENTTYRRDNGRRVCVTCRRTQAQRKTKGYGKPGRPSNAARAAMAARHLRRTG